MFKRANKITSLLVAAAAVVSLVPASAADVKKVDSEDGTIYSAVAYADGKAYVDGEINDSEAAYYLADGKYTELEDVDSGDDVTQFGEKYLDVNDGDYSVNLEDGTVDDNDIAGDTADDAAAALRKEIKDDTEDRYNEDDADEIKDEDALDIIPGAKYGKVWYNTTYTYASGSTANATATSFNIYTDTEGNYIDADYNLGKVKVTTTGAGTKTVTIENTNDTYDVTSYSDSANDGSDALSASVTQGKVLTQDADYIYRLATVKVTLNDAANTAGTQISEINGIAVGTSALDITSDGQTVTFKAIQKISKAQASDDVDGANYAKTVTTYALADSDGKTLGNADLFTSTTAQYTIAGGKLIAYDTTDTDTVEANAYTLKTSGGFYYADEEDSSSESVEYNTDDSVYAVQTDVDGNLWRLDGGYIYKFDNTDDWDKVYKVDGSLDKLSVYDADNMISWSEDDEVYSVIGGGTTTDATDDATDDATTTPVVTPVVTAGWAKATDGTWTYNKADGTKATGWLNLSGSWYYLKADGVMATGWANDGGTWYYLAGSGAMQTGWVNDNGTWYYCNASGAMLANTTVGGYTLGASGAWVK